MDTPDPQRAAREKDLLEQANGVMQTLGFEEHQYRIGHDRLRDVQRIPHRIAVIEDDRKVYEYLIAQLVFATDGNAHFFRPRGEAIEELAQAVIDTDAEFVLVDNGLSYTEGSRSHIIAGINVMTEILRLRSDIKCIGYSSQLMNEKPFMKAGAVGFILKGEDINFAETLAGVIEEITRIR